ncbi:MAG TPA: adenosylcobinamide-GDP ribazoletransferase [Aliidongia sp.]|nr:adenosylcobinamide-GDP ribazoletransferase [Aliidongia sp.]
MPILSRRARFGPAEQLALGLVFLTRLPIRLRGALPDDAVARAAWSFPIAGALVALAGAGAAILADMLRLPPMASALLALAATMAITGALHEDGLADTADGLGGGRTRERKLEIMKDSRIGSYGVLALMVGVGLRAAALASLVVEPRIHLLGALVAAHAGSRALLPLLMRALPSVRPGGLAASVGVPSAASAFAALVLGTVATFWGLGDRLGLVGFVAAAVGMVAVGVLARRQIGGYTGDVLGAAQQIGEIILLLVAAAQFPIPF